MTRYQLTLLITFSLFVHFSKAQTVLDTSFRCNYSQIHFFEPIYPYGRTPAVERMVDEICQAAKIPKDFRLIGAAISSVAAIKDPSGDYLVYSPYFAQVLLDQNPKLLYAILAHEIGHLSRRHHLDGKHRLSEESSADEFMGRVLFRLNEFTSINQLLNSIKKLEFAYDPLYKTANGKSFREEVITNGWRSSEVLIQSQGDLGYFNESGTDRVPIPVFKRKGCPRNFKFDRSYFSSCKKLGDVDQLLSKALNELGYEQRSYFYINNGFAMLTSVEQIHQNGSPLSGSDRWQDYPALDKVDGILDYLSSIIFPRHGYFRLFVFYVTDQNIDREDGHVKHEEARAWLQNGAFLLPDILGGKPLTTGYQVSAMVYEFEAPETTQRMEERCSGNLLSVNDHLAKAGIFFALRQRD